MTELINLTPHDVRLFVDGVCRHVWPASMTPARAVFVHQNTELMPGIPVNRLVFKGVKGLPAEKDGTYYIVSSLVLDAAIDRYDLLVPDTHATSLVRDRFGIVGVRRFRMAPRRPVVENSFACSPTVFDMGMLYNEEAG